jgi:hypothetical protein
MSAFRLAREAEEQLDAIWLRIAPESGRIEIASHFIDSITDRFWLLTQNRSREERI